MIIIFRIEKLEMLDEVNLFYELLNHYCISWAFNDVNDTGKTAVFTGCVHSSSIWEFGLFQMLYFSHENTLHDTQSNDVCHVCFVKVLKISVSIDAHWM